MAARRARSFLTSRRVEARPYEGSALLNPNVAEDNPAAELTDQLQSDVLPRVHVSPATAVHVLRLSRTPPLRTATALQYVLPW